MAINIPRLPYNVPIVELTSGNPTENFTRWWLEVAMNLESQFGDITDALADITQLQTDMAARITEITALQADMADRITEITTLQTQMQDTIDDLTVAQADLAQAQSDITDLVNDLAAAVADIVAAQASADAAQADATEAAREAGRIASYPNPGSVITAADVGSDVTVTIANHTRVYPVQGGIDVPDVSITGGTITGLSFSTRYFIYYDDTTLADTTPTFVATTNSATAQVGAANGRHFLGYVDTPADGGSSTGGTGGAPPGGGGGGGGGEIP